MIFKSVTISLVGGLLLGFLFPQQSPPALPKKPSFIEQVPRGHYLGISIECQQLAEAREDSMENIIKQILQQIGAEYNLEFEKQTNAKDNQVGINVNDRFSYSSGGILADIEVKDSYFEKVKGKYMFYTLVYFPQPKILHARQLIEAENSKRIAQFNSFLEEGILSESNSKIVDALSNYKLALNQAKNLFKDKSTKKIIVEGYIDNLSSRIRLKKVSNYNQRNKHYVSCEVFYDNKPLSAIPVRFQFTKGKGFIAPIVHSDSSGTVRCDVSVVKEQSFNEIRARIDIEGINSGVLFNFSSAEPKPTISTSQLEVKENCFVFELKESNNVDVVFDQYEVSINAEYKNASFINYYIAHVDSSKHTSHSFDLLNPVKIKGGLSKTVRIPFNNWTKEKIDELDKWYMGSKLDYRVILKGDGISIPVQ